MRLERGGTWEKGCVINGEVKKVRGEKGKKKECEEKIVGVSSNSLMGKPTGEAQSQRRLIN